jgi:hypothetical protein
MAASSLTCAGNIQPTSGITSTPVADPGSNQLYVVAFQQPGQHVLHALDVRSGRESWHQTVAFPREPASRPGSCRRAVPTCARSGRRAGRRSVPAATSGSRPATATGP